MADKHGYSTDAERIEKIKSNRPIVDAFWDAMQYHILALRNDGISFFVFDMDLDNKIIYTGIRSCCKDITDDIRNNMADLISQNTIFDKIIWEI